MMVGKVHADAPMRFGHTCHDVFFIHATEVGAAGDLQIKRYAP